MTEATPMWPSDVLQADASGQHPGLAWRLGGRTPPSTAVAPGANPDVKWQAERYRATHVQNTCKLARCASQPQHPHGALYHQTLKRRTTWLTQVQRANLACLRIDGRLKTGVGEPGVFECQVALHPVTGMPRLVGSGLHGLLASWCFDRYDTLDPATRPPRDDLLALFGNRWGEPDVIAGHLTVYDAWWQPEEANARGPLEPEVDTPHHVDYYAGRASEATDFDSPSPQPQIAVAGQFQFALSVRGDADDRAWAGLCMQWLTLALVEVGTGASRRVGYGRFQPPTAQGK